MTSFSGFSSPAKSVDKNKYSKTETTHVSKTNKDGDSQSHAKSKGGKGPGENKKGKASMKRSSVTENEPKKSKKSKRKAELDEFSANMQSMFSQFSDNLLSALSQSQNQNRAQEHNGVFENRPSTSSSEHASNATIEQFDLFSEDDCGDSAFDNANELDENENDEVDFEISKIFEDADKFGQEVEASIAKIVEAVIGKKADVTSLVKKEDNKIPNNCKGLNPPAINPEIWQNLDRRARGQDLMFQAVQRLLGLGIVPILRIANLLKTKSVDQKAFRELTNRAIAILCNAFFELSVRRRMLLRPHIDRRFNQLINRNEPIGLENLFGDDVSKRLRDINEAHKLNRNLSNSKNFKRPWSSSRGRNNFRGGNNRGTARTTPYYARMPRNCRLQAFQGLNRGKKP